MTFKKVYPLDFLMSFSYRWTIKRGRQLGRCS